MEDKMNQTVVEEIVIEIEIEELESRTAPSGAATLGDL
jgi:hypothetical protein